MAQNLATKFSGKTTETLKKKTVIGGLTNRNFKWVTEDTIKVYSVDDMTMNDYTRSGDDRYGTPEEIGTSLQTWTLGEDRSFSGVIDRLNSDHSMKVVRPGSVLARQLKNVVVPEVDAYVLQTIVTAGALDSRDDISTDAAVSAANAYTNFLLINSNISDNEAPEDGRIAVMTANYYNFLKQSGFVLASEKGQQSRHTGGLGTVDGCEVRIAPSGRLPANTELIITHPDVTTFADALTDYITHKNPKGINGWLVEGRICYDAFVDTNKTKQIGIHKTA